MKPKKNILALGADVKNKFLFASQKGLCFGPEIGDLSYAENYELFERKALKVAGKNKPFLIACDLHPDYFSTKFAEAFAFTRPTGGLYRIQHHHAHIASVMLEHGLEKSVIGVSFDGTGFGADGNIWGGEFLLVGKKGFSRLAHLKYNKMPGGEKVVSEPWRMALGVLGKKAAPFIKGAGKREKEAVLSICEKNINSPVTSSAGRLFDVASALLGACTHASREAEAPLRLEAMCAGETNESYKFDISKRNRQYIIDPQRIFLGMLEDLKMGKDKKNMAVKFHNSMVNIIADTVKKLSKKTRLTDIALSGGVFQNKFLKRKIIKRLISSGFRVFTNEKTPVNDFNISLGQYYVLSRSGKN